MRSPPIATNLGCGQQTVRDAIHDFNAGGVDALVAKSSRPRRTRDAFDERSAEALREMLHLASFGSFARITPVAIVSAELVIEPPGLLGSSEQTITGESRTSLGR